MKLHIMETYSSLPFLGLSRVLTEPETEIASINAATKRSNPAQNMSNF